MLKKNFRIIFIFLLLCCSSCFAQREDVQEELIQENGLLIEILDELLDILSTRDKQKILNIADKITDTEIMSEKGMEYLKIKLLVLTFCGEYEDAFYEVIKGLELYPDDHELLIAKGFLGKKLNIDTNSYYLALDIIEEELKFYKKTHLIIKKYYLQLVLDDNMDSINLEPYRTNLPLYFLLQNYNDLDFDELLLSPPIGFIAPRPLIRTDSGNSTDEWWLLLD